MSRRSGTGQRGLLLDYAGVLTGPVSGSFVSWEREHGFEDGEAVRIITSAADDADDADADGGLVGQFERGELSTEQFAAAVDRRFAQLGRPAPARSLLEAVLACMEPTGPMWAVAEQARAQGVRVGLLSNSWGTSMYPRQLLDDVFDVQVISCEVGLRKPDPEIYRLAARWLGVPLERCAFVDDLDHNVGAAEELGMFGVLHAGDAPSTVDRLHRFLGAELVVERVSIGRATAAPRSRGH